MNQDGVKRVQDLSSNCNLTTNGHETGMVLLCLIRPQLHKPKIIASYLASDTPLNLNVRDSDTLRVYPGLFMRKSQKRSSYWTLRIIWRIASVLQYQAMANNKEDDQIQVFFLWLMELSGEKAFSSQQGVISSSLPSQNDLSYYKRAMTHMLPLLCAPMPALVSTGFQRRLQAKPQAENFLPHTILCHAPHGFEGSPQREHSAD